jgi:hypothetical protein
LDLVASSAAPAELAVAVSRTGMNTLLIIEFSLSRKKRVNKQVPAPDQLQREENGYQIRECAECGLGKSN